MRCIIFPFLRKVEFHYVGYYAQELVYWEH
jgi:hypothetical protein